MWCPSKTVFPVLLDNLLGFFVRFFHWKPSSLGNEQKKGSFKNSLVQVEREKRKGGKEWQKIMTHITWCPSGIPDGFQWGSTCHSGASPSRYTVWSGCFYDYPSDKIHTSLFNLFFTSSFLTDTELSYWGLRLGPPFVDPTESLSSMWNRRIIKTLKRERKWKKSLGNSFITSIWESL